MPEAKPVDIWVYIHGFNLYNGALKATPYKWLDLQSFAEKLRPGDRVPKVKFFTAQVDRRFDAPQQPVRQRLYWRALRTLPTIEIIEGHFKTRVNRLPLEASVQAIERAIGAGGTTAGMRPTFVAVRRSEEKGTDVNIATHLINDAHLHRFDAAILVSNDSDLAEAIRIARSETGKAVHVHRPSASRPNAELQSAATSFNNINTNHLRTSQFPATLSDARGIFGKPAGW